jgi:DNA-binding NarL/FixJ family response regulator
VLIDNELIFCAGLALAAGCAKQQITVLAVAGTLEAGQEAVERLAPAVVVLNAALAGSDDLSAIRTLRRTNSSTAVMVMGEREEDDVVFSAMQYGAAAFVLRTIDGDTLCSVIRQVAAGAYLIDGTVLDRPALVARILHAFSDLSAWADRDRIALFVPLSARELEVLASIAQGRTNKEAAAALQISDQTVKNHITSIMRKLAVNDRTHAVVYALQRGWIPS